MVPSAAVTDVLYEVC